MATAYLRRLALAMAGVLAAGCAAQHSPPPARNPDRYIYVTTASTLPGQCFHDLGSVQVTEPFGAAAIDANGSKAARKIRAVALAKYPDKADAVVNLHSEQNEVGTTVTVAGEAVELTNHTTLACELDDANGVLHGTGATAVGGIAGTAAGGMITASQVGAMYAGALGLAVTGAYELLAYEGNKEAQREQILRRLANQQREIKELQSERARLATCQEKEIPLSGCELELASETPENSADQARNRDYRNTSRFALLKHVQEQENYIAQLKQQISQTKWEMANPTHY